MLIVYCNQVPQESNQTPQESNQSSQQSNQVAHDVTFMTHQDFVTHPPIKEREGEDEQNVEIFPVILPVVSLIQPTTSSTKTTTTTARVDKTTSTAIKDDDTDGNTCSSDRNSEIFFEHVQIFNNEDMDCSKEFNAKDTFKYPTCTAAYEACQDSADCIGVTSTNHIIKVSNINSIQLNSETENVEIINFQPPTDFDFNHDKVFVKHCFSTIETDTSEFKELETLDCNAEIECSDGYRKKNFDCVDIDECKLDHDCTFEGKTFHLSAKSNIVAENLWDPYYG